MLAPNASVAPSSTLAAFGVMLTTMSLVIATVAASDFVGSATLVAATCTLAGDGKSAGAVYRPAAEIVPVAALPPATPFTLHVTAVFVVFVTVALNASVFPNNTDPLLGATVTTICGGGGGPSEPPVLVEHPHTTPTTHANRPKARAAGLHSHRANGRTTPTGSTV
jgi:hypothetical protein